MIGLSWMIDITPAKFACVATASCPAILLDEANGRYIIIGKLIASSDPAISGRVGPNEAGIEIPIGLLDEVMDG